MKYFSETPLKNFRVDASDHELFEGEAYSNLANTRSCGQFQGTPVINIPNELICALGTVGRYVYLKTGFQYLVITEFEVYQRRK